MQKTKTRAKSDEAVVDVTDEATTSSDEVVEAANCCLAEIDALLDDVEEALEGEVLPYWHPDAEFDPNGARPVEPNYSDVYDYAEAHGMNVQRYMRMVRDLYWERDKQWHESRGLTYERSGCVCW